jgi:tetratricopeptide (TPR) repeat protein
MGLLMCSLEAIQELAGTDTESTGVQAPGLQWLRLNERLPENVKIVISTTSHTETFKLIEYAYENSLGSGNSWERHFVQVANLSAEKAEIVINRWLEKGGRCLQADQKAAVLKSISDSEDGATGLLLKLAYQATLHWASYDPVPVLPTSICGFIQEIFNYLERYLGYELVSKAFSYLVCARQGLSERELMDVLSCDDEVMDAVLQYHKPPKRRLPPAVFTRMMQQLGDYLEERSSDGIPVVMFKYRPFVDVVNNKYMKTVVKRREICLMLADYFDGVLHYRFIDRDIDPQPSYFKHGEHRTPNMRRLSELPHALISSGDHSRLAERLSDLEAFSIYASDNCLMHEMIVYWREIEGTEDPVALYTEELLQREKLSVGNREAQLEVATLYESMSEFFNLSAKFTAGIDMAKKALLLREAVHGPEDFELAQDLDTLARMYGNLGMASEAQPLYKRSVSILESKFGANDPRVAVSLNNLASLHQALGQYQQALALYERVLVIFEDTCGAESMEVGIVLNNIGSLNVMMCASDPGRKMLSMALPRLESKLGSHHPSVCSCLNNLSAVYIQMRLPNKALGMLERDLAASEKILGPMHPDVATTLNNMAILFSRMQVRHWSHAENILGIAHSVGHMQKTFLALRILLARSTRMIYWYKLSGACASEAVCSARAYHLQRGVRRRSRSGGGHVEHSGRHLRGAATLQARTRVLPGLAHHHGGRHGAHAQADRLLQAQLRRHPQSKYASCPKIQTDKRRSKDNQNGDVTDAQADRQFQAELRRRPQRESKSGHSNSSLLMLSNHLLLFNANTPLAPCRCSLTTSCCSMLTPR